MTNTVLITGTSSGLGRATARLFQAQGWNVVATMRKPEAESELTRLARTVVTRLDVQDNASIDSAVAAGVAAFGRIDVGEQRRIRRNVSAPPGPPTSFVMMELLFCVTLARIGTREPVRPVRFTTRTLPDSLAPYEDFLGAPVSRGARNQVSFAGTDARLPFLTSNDGLWTAFEPDLRARLADLATPATTTQRTRAAMLEALPSGLVTIEAIARKLALSPRTLQRQIKAEGTSYQQILRETRESLAQHYLERTALPASEISFLLGFDEPNSFYRAFKSWTGTTPDTARTRPREARTAPQ